MSNRFQERKKHLQRENYFDYTLLFVVLFLLGFGLVMIYSASSYKSALDYGDAAFFLKKQAGAAVLGIIAMFVVARIPYNFWERFAVFGYLVSFVLIALVLTPLGMEKNGARRWLNLGVSVQPAEIAKLCMILFLASFVCKLGNKIRTKKGFFISLCIPVPICAMIYLITNNLSSAIIIFGIAILMIFVASPDYAKFVAFGVGGISLAGVLVYIISKAATTGGGFRVDRILAWLNPEAYATDEGFQTLQALYAIGSGGIFGKGLGQSMQKLGFLPEAQKDRMSVV